MHWLDDVVSVVGMVEVLTLVLGCEDDIVVDAVVGVLRVVAVDVIVEEIDVLGKDVVEVTGTVEGPHKPQYKGQ
jgi:hypothetical protein